MGLLTDFAIPMSGPATRTTSGSITSQFASGEGALGVLTWTGATAPSGTITSVFGFMKLGSVVTIFWNVRASVSGVTVSALSTPLPATCPAVLTASNQVNDSWAYMGTGAVLAGANSLLNNGAGCGLYKDSAGIYQLRVFSGVSSLAANFAMGSVTYITSE